MKLRMIIYGLLVNRVPTIGRQYHDIRKCRRTKTGRLYAWFALIGMNIAWLFGKRRFGANLLNPDAHKKIPADRSESSLSKRESPKEMASRLMEYDVISFDIFDTLIFRPFSRPTDLFFLLSEKLNYLDLERIRQEMERKARERRRKEEGHEEVTLKEIWEVMERECGIDKETGMKFEIETETAVCFANPYMLEVFRYLKGSDLKGSGKKIIAVSDMYLPSEVIRQIVEGCGYEGIGGYYVSCEYGASKSDGRLYRLVMERMGKQKRYVHVGDNLNSDITRAKKSGWHGEYYRNVNEAGAPYRAEDMSIITGSVYWGIVNAHIHNGLREYSREYELGYIYGGIFVLGYCQFIHEYVRTHDIDKILFLSRDGDILHQVYTMLYPEDSGEGKTEYVYWSRLAAVKMAAGYYKYDYFRRFLYHKVNQGYTLASVFETMELEDILWGCISYLNWKEKGKHKYTRDSWLTDRNVDGIKEFLLENWEDVLSHYAEQLEAGKVYYGEVLKGLNRVAAVDVGWAGSGAVALDYIVNHVWKLDCEVVGLLAGTNTVHNEEPDMSEALLGNGKLVSYLFSQGHNRDLWKLHDAGYGDNLAIENLLVSDHGALIGFYKDKNIKFSQSDRDNDKNKEIEAGMKDFVNQTSQMLKVGGYDAYAVIRQCILNRYSKYDRLNVGL